MLKIVLQLIAVILLLLRLSFAQDDSLYSKWAEFNEESAAILEVIQHLTENPVHLNDCNKSELSEVPFLRSANVDSIISYRNTHQKISSKRELRKILGKDLYAVVRPFFTTQPKKLNHGYIKQKNYYAINVNAAEKKYEGGPWYNKSKLHYAINPSMHLGFITQKDAGEQNTLDYLGGYFSYQRKQYKIIIGQYNFHFAHGLAFTNPFSNQKSSMVMNPLRYNKSYGRSSLSSSENSGLFGLYASTNKWLNSDIQFFFSHHQIDGSLDDTNEHIIGFDADGLHRTENERQTKNRILEQVLGIAVSRSLTKNLSASMLVCDYTYEPKIFNTIPIVSEEDHRRKYYNFSGSDLKQLSTNYAYASNNFHLSGEWTISNRGTPGYSQKISIVNEWFDLGAAWWYLTKDFQSPHGSVFDESSSFPRAENGFYLASKLKLSDVFSLKAYKFFRKGLWRGYFNTLPNVKEEWFFESTLKKLKREAYLRIRYKKSNTEVYDQSGNIKIPKQTIYQFHYNWRPDKQLRLQTRIALTRLNVNHERGMYVFQGMRYGFFKWLMVYYRLTFFNTDSFNSALYEYENDLPGSFANFALYGQGHKMYLMGRCQAGRHVQTWIKLRYLKRRQTPAIQAVTDRDLRFQVNYIF